MGPGQRVVLTQPHLLAGPASRAAGAQGAVSAGGAEGDLAGPVDRPSDAARTGDGAGLIVDGEVVHGESTRNGGVDRPRLDQWAVAVAGQRLEHVAGAVGGVTEHLDRLLALLGRRNRDVGLDQLDTGGGVTGALAAGLGHGALGAGSTATWALNPSWRRA